jgi:hypothetical protein
MLDLVDLQIYKMYYNRVLLHTHFDLEVAIVLIDLKKLFTNKKLGSLEGKYFPKSCTKFLKPLVISHFHIINNDPSTLVQFHYV